MNTFVRTQKRIRIRLTVDYLRGQGEAVEGEQVKILQSFLKLKFLQIIKIPINSIKIEWIYDELKDFKILILHGSAIPIICFGFDFAPFYNKNPLYGQFYEYLYNVFSPYFVYKANISLMKTGLRPSYSSFFFISHH